VYEDKDYTGTEFTIVPNQRVPNLGKLDMGNDIESMKITCGKGYVYFQVEQTGSIFTICSVFRAACQSGSTAVWPASCGRTSPLYQDHLNTSFANPFLQQE